MAKRKRTNNDPQSTTQKTKGRATRIPLKTGGELGCSGRVAIPTPLVAPIVLLSNLTVIVLMSCDCAELEKKKSRGYQRGNQKP
jgi:hypothetical protein